MRYCRYSSPEGAQFGLIEHLDGTPQITHILPETDDGLPDLQHPKRVKAQSLASVQLLAPVRPSKIVCVGRNYLDHAKELGNDAPKEPLIFFKPPSSIIAPDERIARPRISDRVDFEGELAVVVKTKCRNLADDQDIRSFILGYTCAND